jgi:hypothetical protein
MLFSVIYEIDVHSEASIRPYMPRNRRPWTVTEGDEGRNYGYLEAGWERGKHRKMVGILTRRQFEAFLNHTGLRFETAETLGSLGAPGCGPGIAPAICFKSFTKDAMCDAYVTPLPARKDGNPIRAIFTERDWQRLKATRTCEPHYDVISTSKRSAFGRLLASRQV